MASGVANVVVFGDGVVFGRNIGLGVCVTVAVE